MSMLLAEQVLSFDPECIKDLGWVPNDWTYKFSPDHVRDVAETEKNASKQRSHQMELRSRDKYGCSTTVIHIL